MEDPNTEHTGNTIKPQIQILNPKVYIQVKANKQINSAKLGKGKI